MSHVADSPKNRHFEPISGRFTPIRLTNHRRERNGLPTSWHPGNVGGPHRPPYAQLKGSWSSMKNGKPLFYHVLQCVSCWKKELPDGDCRQSRRDYTKCPGTRSRGTWAGDRCYPTASKVHRRQLVADARPDSAQKTGCQGYDFNPPLHSWASTSLRRPSRIASRLNSWGSFVRCWSAPCSGCWPRRLKPSTC